MMSGTEIFISSDMFFLEVLLEPSGLARDVKIHHEGKNEQQVNIINITIIFSYSMSLFLFLSFLFCERVAKRLHRPCRAETLLISPRSWKDSHRFIN